MLESFARAFLIIILLGLLIKFLINAIILYVSKWLRIGVSLSLKTSVVLAFFLQLLWSAAEIFMVQLSFFAFLGIISVFINYVFKILAFSLILWLSSRKFVTIKINNPRSAIILATILVASDFLLPLILSVFIKY
ncbi:hypothetical protein A2715_05405 [Candidatus Woesebacteria bacterium RIFCSPHIGHO2_01_FULL_39_32]|uniref:Uncharacterized protein n=1 Tax=Candidatus Woesebacteria bacterium RIFCSPLOWO2_01_FULL_39_25 TaxID=1802521 RepID=A0A1F8BLP1_9BACT|nr:MAG: hypothetical protein A2715_05405 [Candidatus Woesebacteria bacterium RIFCSPHIGHO2_01_FULL_39_32]OGM38559.1 MAG: hypothetical protein A3F01_04360 [Candidatus Woesebacteria bacterium RIFCSPHIGHO2_12_FULL_38_11]OGM64987.1 MAG: hypothetical protein A2893_05015 [Candidatus Woesebacteria bacterium RIFCSPLOWO2_01_FULL_39_25]